MCICYQRVIFIIDLFVSGVVFAPFEVIDKCIPPLFLSFNVKLLLSSIGDARITRAPVAGFVIFFL